MVIARVERVDVRRRAIVARGVGRGIARIGATAEVGEADRQRIRASAGAEVGERRAAPGREIGLEVLLREHELIVDAVLDDVQLVVVVGGPQITAAGAHITNLDRHVA